MKMSQLTGGLALGCMLASQAWALEPQHFKVYSTGDLATLCAASPGDQLYAEGRAYCLAYIDGVMDYHAALTAGPKFNAIVCPGTDVTRDEVAEVFVAWSRRQGQELNSEAPVHGVMRAVVAEWPCAGE